MYPPNRGDVFFAKSTVQNMDLIIAAWRDRKVIFYWQLQYRSVKSYFQMYSYTMSSLSRTKQAVKNRANKICEQALESIGYTSQKLKRTIHPKYYHPMYTTSGNIFSPYTHSVTNRIILCPQWSFPVRHPRDQEISSLLIDSTRCQ